VEASACPSDIGVESVDVLHAAASATPMDHAMTVNQRIPNVEQGECRLELPRKSEQIVSLAALGDQSVRACEQSVPLAREVTRAPT
jgi:hypothetical protein